MREIGLSSSICEKGIQGFCSPLNQRNKLSRMLAVIPHVSGGGEGGGGTIERAILGLLT